MALRGRTSVLQTSLVLTWVRWARVPFMPPAVRIRSRYTRDERCIAVQGTNFMNNTTGITHSHVWLLTTTTVGSSRGSTVPVVCPE